MIRFADFTGDSYKLSQQAARPTASTSSSAACISWRKALTCWPSRADDRPTRSERRLLHGRHGRDHPGGRCWEQLVGIGLTTETGEGITPITYMNSTAAIKAFCGERGGLVCTSCNANGAFKWAFAKNEKLFFLPDQHLGRNTGLRWAFRSTKWWSGIRSCFRAGHADRLRKAKVILWKGHCSVHQRFLPEHVDKVRAKYPDIRVIVHPECRWRSARRPTTSAPPKS